jgi:hypothetical protein
LNLGATSGRADVQEEADDDANAQQDDDSGHGVVSPQSKYIMLPWPTGQAQ